METIAINREITSELEFVMNDLRSEGNLPSVWLLVEDGKLNKKSISVTATKEQFAELAYWVKRDMNYRQDVTLTDCLRDTDYAGASAIRNYVAKCQRLLLKIEGLGK